MRTLLERKFINMLKKSNKVLFNSTYSQHIPSEREPYAHLSVKIKPITLCIHHIPKKGRLFFRAITDLNVFSLKPKITRAERAIARQMILELYTAGFTPGEIEYLCNARWKNNTIAKYCRGLEVKRTSEKDRALGLMKEFILNDGSWEELEYYIETKKKLGTEGLNIGEVIEQKKNIDFHKLELTEIASISTTLKDKGSNWTQFLDYMKLVLDVLKLGYTVPDLETLYTKTLELGGIESTIRNIVYAFSEVEVQKEINACNKKIENLIDKRRGEERKLEEIMHQAKIKQIYVGYAERLLDTFKLDPFALQTILIMAENFGEPTNILQALITYGTQSRLEENVQKKREALKTYDAEIVKLQAQKQNCESDIADLHRRIGAIEEKYKQSTKLQQIVNLIDDPLNAEIPPQEFMLLSLAVLIGIRNYSSTHSTALPKWEAFVKTHVDTAVDRLNNIFSGKL